VDADEFRVEVELNDEADARALAASLRGIDDADARERLGHDVIVTRNGPRLFLYTADPTHAREAERLARERIAADGVAARIAVTRWHDVEEDWKDASLPLPQTDEERQAEYSRREAAEAREAEEEGEYDWHVVAHLPGRDDAAQLAGRLRAEGISIAHRWRYVVAGALTEERAEELAARIRDEVPAGSEVSVEVNLSAVHVPTLLFLPS
jgi:hypothetical protein